METSARTHRVSTFRGFPSFRRNVNAHDVRALWAERAARSHGRSVWMHVHVPYCPQICSFCHCGKELLGGPADLERWLERTRDEVAFFAPAFAGARIRNMYFGGGTPNLLAPEQLDALLTLLERNFDLDPDGRRTLEILPSSHSRGTLDVATAHGIRRLSCGVQSTSFQLLRPVGRAADFEPLERLMEEARALGIDDINIDLAWGLKGDSESVFFQSLADVAKLGPTSVSVHLLIPTATNPVFASEQEERELYRRFRALPDGELAAKFGERFPEYEWRKLPTVVVLVHKDYVARGEYRSWQYSDMETVGMDMFGLGRFAQSHLLGGARYENMTAIDRFDPDERGYGAARVDGVVDGAMDVLSDLLRDGVSSFEDVASRYPEVDLAVVRDRLDRLVEGGELGRDGSSYRWKRGDSILFGAPGELVDVARERAKSLNADASAPAGSGRRKSQQFELVVDDIRLPLVIERARPNAPSYAVVGELAVSHGNVFGVSPRALDEAMQRVVRAMRESSLTGLSALESVRAELLRRFPAHAKDGA